MNKPLSRSFLALASIAGLATLASFDHKVAQVSPSFIIFLTDDLGYGDLACYGNPINSTPNLDRFALEGVRLTDCHSAGTVCSPSRAGILTGRNPYRSGFSYIAGGKTYLRNNEITIAELLKSKEYQTGFFGKWHLSNLEDTTQPDPGDQGFDYWLATSVNAFEGPQNPLKFIRNGKRTGRLEGWYCDIVVNESLNWLSKIDRKKPFLLVVCTHEPHSPVAPPDSLLTPFLNPDLLPLMKTIKYGGVDRGEEISQVNAAEYYATIKQLDNAFGTFIQGVDRSGFRDNTLVFVTSDNGPENPVNFEESRGEWSDSVRNNCYGTPGPFRGMKRFPYEGGHCVPGLVRWPAKIPAGLVSDKLINGTDILPVFCQLAGVAIPTDRKIDGNMSFNALLNKSVNDQKTSLWIFPTHEDTWYRMPHMALRSDKFVLLGWFPTKKDDQKLLDWVKQSVPERFELYDIERDPGQLKNISFEYPEVAAELASEMTSVWLDILVDYKQTVNTN